MKIVRAGYIIFVSDIKTNATGLAEEFSSWWIERLNELVTDKIVNVRI